MINESKNKQLLLINDLAGYGKVALSVMLPILSHMGHHLYNLPTAIISNTLDYGQFNILETTDHMEKTLKIWDNLKFSFDAIATGFIASEKQQQLIETYCKRETQKGVLLFVDPIMADDGKLYNGVPKETIASMKRMISVADYIVPNYTEAAFLTDTPYNEQGINKKDSQIMIDKLRKLGAKSVIITSAIVDGENVVIGYDHIKDINFSIPFEKLPTRFVGTGDIFSAILIGRILDGKTLETSTKSAMDIVKQLIALNFNNSDKYKGIPIESHLDLI
jgi:pyridoxine kinase